MSTLREARAEVRKPLQALNFRARMPPPARFSALTRRIIFFNAVALVVLIGGVITVQSSSVGLIEERVAGIQDQALIVANTLAEYTTDENTRSINSVQARPLLRQLIEPTKLRAQLYNRQGNLQVDTRNLLSRNVVQTFELPPLGFWSRTEEALSQLYDGVMGVRPFTRLEPYFEAGNNGRVYREVTRALGGEIGSAERVNERNKLVLSVAVPVQRFKAIYGVLLVSTEGGDIDDILRQERATLLEVFVVALIVMVVSSFYLAGAVAEPVKRLAEAADRVRRGRLGRENIPDMSERRDEIGDLSVSLSSMTQALYDRIDAIESFAADVAHELKNPLTSLKSAVEMFGRANDDASRARLMSIIRNDVKRIDRLITDISDASRLDAELSRETSEPIDITRLLETIVEIYRYTELPRAISLATALNIPPGTTVMGRDERLGQIFRNLIDNAVSFSPKDGTVTIGATLDDHRVRVTVDDEGPGIPPENLESVFQRFYTERPAEHGFGKNSGLGLSIARQIVEDAGGRVWAENRAGSEERAGARFIVELPLAGGRR
jgi:two-component system sensor histidine kinase ChvG